MNRSYRANYINEYIQQADNILESGNCTLAEDFCNEVIATFSAEIDSLFDQSLTEYWGENLDYLKDTKILRAKLKNYKNCIEAGFIKQHPSMNENSGTHIDIKNDIDNQISISISFEQTIDQVSKIPEEQLSQTEKDMLKGKLVDVDIARRQGANKKTIWEKAKPILEFLMTKGADVVIAAMPYIIEAMQKAG